MLKPYGKVWQWYYPFIPRERDPGINTSLYARTFVTIQHILTDLRLGGLMYLGICMLL